MENTKQHLSARQVVNRYLKGVYTDECADTISAAISSSSQSFNSVAIPIQSCWVDEVMENIELCFKLNERTDDKDAILSVVSDERARSVLSDLATPDVWIALLEEKEMFDVLYAHGLMSKYPLRNCYSVLDAYCHSEKDRLKELGINYLKLLSALSLMFKEQFEPVQVVRNA